MMNGRSPSGDTSARPLAYSSFTAGPAPRKKLHSTLMPSALNSSSRRPLRCKLAAAPPPTKGRLPMPTPGNATRITEGLSPAKARSARAAKVAAAAPASAVLMKDRRFMSLVSWGDVYLTRQKYRNAMDLAVLPHAAPRLLLAQQCGRAHGSGHRCATSGASDVPVGNCSTIGSESPQP